MPTRRAGKFVYMGLGLSHAGQDQYRGLMMSACFVSMECVWDGEIVSVSDEMTLSSRCISDIEAEEKKTWI